MVWDKLKKQRFTRRAFTRTIIDCSVYKVNNSSLSPDWFYNITHPLARSKMPSPIRQWYPLSNRQCGIRNCAKDKWPWHRPGLAVWRQCAGAINGYCRCGYCGWQGMPGIRQNRPRWLVFDIRSEKSFWKSFCNILDGLLTRAFAVRKKAASLDNPPPMLYNGLATGETPPL